MHLSREYSMKSWNMQKNVTSRQEYNVRAGCYAVFYAVPKSDDDIFTSKHRKIMALFRLLELESLIKLSLYPTEVIHAPRQRHTTWYVNHKFHERFWWQWQCHVMLYPLSYSCHLDQYRCRSHSPVFERQPNFLVLSWNFGGYDDVHFFLGFTTTRSK